MLTSQTKKNQLMFSSEELLKNQNEAPEIMDDIFVGKQVEISSHNVTKLY